MLVFPKCSIWPETIFSSYFDLSKTALFGDQFICQQNIAFLWSLANSG